MTLLCVPLVGRTVEEMKIDAAAAAAAGGDLVEIRLDYIEGFRPREDLPRLLHSCPLPVLVTYRFDLLFACFSIPGLVVLKFRVRVAIFGTGVQILANNQIRNGRADAAHRPGVFPCLLLCILAFVLF